MRTNRRTSGLFRFSVRTADPTINNAILLPISHVAVLAIVAFAGCAEPKYYPVRGVILDEQGQPFVELAGAAVAFEAVGQPVSAVGEVAADATFVMTSEVADDGCIPGEHRVSIGSPPSNDGDIPLPRVIDRRYEDLATSGLTVTVKKQRGQVIQLQVPRLKKE